MVDIRIAIVSLNQRGFWLAQELAHLNKKTNSSFKFDLSFFNLNFKKKSIVYDEMEGPFGGYLTESMEQNFTDLCQHEEPFQIQPQGLTVWTEKGPLEARSLMFDKRKNVMNPFSLRLFEQFAATTTEKKIFTTEVQRAVKYRYFNRNYSINSAERIKQKLIEDHIRYFDKTDLIDIQMPSGFKKQETQIEFSGEIRGIENFDFVIWCMTSEEIKHYFPKIFEKLVFSWSRKTLKTIEKHNQHILYYWMPFTFKCELSPELTALPDHFVLTTDSELLVHSENLFIAKKSVMQGFYQIWSLIPSSQVMRNEYFEQKAILIENIFQEKIKRLNFKLHSLPQRLEAYDPGLFPVYYDLSAFNFVVKNSYYHSSEVWSSYLINDQFENMKKIRDHIQIQVMKNFKEKKVTGPSSETEI